MHIRDQCDFPGITSQQKKLNLGRLLLCLDFVQMYRKMLDSGYKPDAITYSTLVAACNREDNLEQALLVSQEMEGLGVKPNQVWNIFYIPSFHLVAG